MRPRRLSMASASAMGPVRGRFSAWAWRAAWTIWISFGSFTRAMKEAWVVPAGRPISRAKALDPTLTTGALAPASGVNSQPVKVAVGSSPFQVEDPVISHTDLPGQGVQGHDPAVVLHRQACAAVSATVALEAAAAPPSRSSTSSALPAAPRAGRSGAAPSRAPESRAPLSRAWLMRVASTMTMPMSSVM